MANPVLPAAALRPVQAYEGAVAGHVLAYVWDGDLEVGYWLGREFWGNLCEGIAHGTIFFRR